MTNIDETSSIHNYVMAQKFYFLAEQCLNLIKKSLNPLLKEYGLNHSQYLILVVLRYSHLTGSKVMSTEMSYLLGLEKHSITPLVDFLCRKGLVLRERSKTDRRVVFLSLTPSGRELIETIQPQTIDSIAAFPDCTTGEFRRMSAFLTELLVLAAEKNGQQPDQFQNAYKKLLSDGADAFEKLQG